ncbi:cAMP-dependent protein kinase catalytic subunit alpha-like [Tropilaelaps mercedesae]|uniref:cAMP-dependent protein kinase catalytic subunit alpha-like n=1 Tax=Tropilaelaps mercedesae TaxID=418985 RepID=A0A1V9XCS4_9ACAR|nr:cAMP-dependent protein kinase catalytic subunit alpha-like [Tropilaelaps mercedesae]
MATVKPLGDRSISEDDGNRKIHKFDPKKCQEESCVSRQSEQKPESIYESLLRAKLTALQLNFNNLKIPSACLDDFEILGFLGEGGYGQVWQVKHKREMELYALKVQSKEKIMSNRNQLRRLINEKNIHSVLDHVFIVKLYYSFKDNACVYLALEYIPCGNLFQAKLHSGGFTEDKTRFFVSQVILALEYLHRSSIIYRDLKPENLLIDIKGFLKVADFGFAKRVTGLTYTFCGTDEYMAPEVLTKRGYEKGPDWWSVGILTYELLYKYSPFFSDTPERLYYRIKNDRVTFPAYIRVSGSARDIILRLLEKDTSDRLGLLIGGVDDVKRHEWFRSTDWLSLYVQKCSVPYKPKQFPAVYADMEKWPRSKELLYEKDFEKF